MEACNADVEWIDIHRNPERVAETGANREFVRERLHVVDDAGVMRVGAQAFGALWSQTPRQRLLAKMIRAPGIGALTSGAYNVFAAGLYRWNRCADVGSESRAAEPGLDALRPLGTLR
jgi:predicted DCC family thiol-disulfide oxidoreductase YuxK